MTPPRGVSIGEHRSRAETGKPKDKRVRLRAGDQSACSLAKLGEMRFTLT